jgi:hypothetical protein
MADSSWEIFIDIVGQNLRDLILRFFAERKIFNLFFMVCCMQLSEVFAFLKHLR